MSAHRYLDRFFLGNLYDQIFPSWVKYLKKELSDCGTVLDLGCGSDSPIQYCNVPFSVAVECFEPYMVESKKKGIHNEYIEEDVRRIEFEPHSFDAVICLEVIEHLSKEDGHELIRKMETWAKKKILITTPNGYLWQDGYDSNVLQEHKSGWTVDELQMLGFKVRGIDGWKKFSGYRGRLIYESHVLYKLRDLSQKITYIFPKSAFRLFAIKQIGQVK